MTIDIFTECKTTSRLTWNWFAVDLGKLIKYYNYYDTSSNISIHIVGNNARKK